MGKRPFSHPSTDIESSRPASVYQQYPPMQERWFAWLVPLFFIVNIAAFVYSMYVNDCPSNVVGTDHCVLQKLLGRFSFQPLSQNPLFGPSSSTLEKMGALEWKLVVKEGEGWRLISCIWLHAGVIHLLANMISLIFVGIRLEEEFGFVKIGLLYVLSGFGGSLLSSISLRSTMSVGASGALFGLLGAMLSELITNWTIYANKVNFLIHLSTFIDPTWEDFEARYASQVTRKLNQLQVIFRARRLLSFGLRRRCENTVATSIGTSAGYGKFRGRIRGSKLKAYEIVDFDMQDEFDDFEGVTKVARASTGARPV
ncbi:hypothetical protein GIB67_021413 [Kingdonia uniflora]|uniref:RHOMBOID-like protein n=1 Tax=Kingdonia uniflora TaxID=39325 RepID=A0A7J7MCX3_9MAGN|nr:hypothetical protein GIB67_021413 [Kingdonia uniflora]